jgi:hypothetical protein
MLYAPENLSKAQINIDIDTTELKTLEKFRQELTHAETPNSSGLTVQASAITRVSIYPTKTV